MTEKTGCGLNTITIVIKTYICFLLKAEYTLFDTSLKVISYGNINTK